MLLKSNNGDITLKASSKSSIIIKQQINDFIAKPKQPNLQIQFDYFWNDFIGFLIPYSIIIWLSISWLLSPVETCIFDKVDNHLLIERKNLFGKNKFKFKLNEFDHSSLQTFLTGYRLVLIMKNTETIILKSSTTKFNKELQLVSDAINDFNLS